MSGMWSRTLVYLGLREEPDEMYDEVAERFDAEGGDGETDAQVRHASRAAVGGIPPRTEPTRRAPAAEEAPRERTRDRHRGRTEPSPAAREESDEERGGSNVRPLRGGSGTHVRAVPSSPLVRTAVIELLVFDDVEAVGARYRTGQPVVFEVGDADRATARRMVDFVAGLTFALRGRLSKVGSNAFLVTPEGIELPDNERQRLRDLGYRLPDPSDA